MVDPFSLITGLTQLVQSAGALTMGLSRFIVKTKYISDTIRGVHDEISELKIAVGEIRVILEKRPKQLPFERDHHAKIHRIIQSCHASLETLAHELPEIKDKTGTLERIRRSLEHSLKQERIMDLIQHISSYKTVLQLSLTTLSLGAIWETTRSQKQIENEIRKLTDAIRMSPHLSLSRRKKQPTPSIHVQSPESDAEEEDPAESTLEKEIRDWRMTANDVATAVSLNDFDGASVDTRSIPPKSSVSVDTLPLYEEDMYDPEPDYRDIPNSEILECQLDANQQIVQHLIQCGIFIKAASYQQRGIKLMEQLLGAQVPPGTDNTSTEKFTDMKEGLADILLQSESAETDCEADAVLRGLLDEEVNRGEGQVDDNRRARLYHKLGQLFFKQGKNTQAERFLIRARDIRLGMKPMRSELIEESAELLVQVLQETQALDKARGLRQWIKRELHASTTLPSPSTASHMTQDNSENIDLTSAYQWCKEQGMNVDSETFKFSSYDPSINTTPMHRAVQLENIEILRYMLSNAAHAVEQVDTSGSTLLHVAAATRNRHICALLLKHHADPNVVDQSGMTPLHRCQTIAKGVDVAEMLLECCPSIVDRVDGLGKTALYLACEKGNKNMAKTLLLKGQANPDIPGPGKCTPLIAAIELATHSSRRICFVELLLLHGADPNIPDVNGRTAFTAAKNAGLAGEEIKRMLSLFPSRRTSSAAMNFIRSSGDDRKRSGSSGKYSLAELSLHRS
ncbi:ankyrin [Annulohypoxylon bovei var. microspora]|nr:ankyrin [Annulohypoxylon bovei var. microspora]